MKAEEYLADKIERAICFYKSRLKKIDGAYLAEVVTTGRHGLRMKPGRDFP